MEQLHHSRSLISSIPATQSLSCDHQLPFDYLHHYPYVQGKFTGKAIALQLWDVGGNQVTGRNPHWLRENVPILHCQ